MRVRRWVDEWGMAIILAVLVVGMAGYLMWLGTEVVQAARPCPPCDCTPFENDEAYIPGELLEDLEARLLWAQATVRRWEDLAERRRGVEAIACEEIAWHISPLPHEVR